MDESVEVNELIRITENQMIDARDLHGFLEVKARFNDWVSRRIEEYSFVEGSDYVILKNEYDHKIKDIHLTLDSAKELAMVEKNDRGRQARRYFIEVEKKWRAEQDSPGSQLRAVQVMINAMVEAERAQLKLEAKHAALHARVVPLEDAVKLLSADSDYRTVRGLAKELRILMPRDAANLCGRRASNQCREMGVAIGKVGCERDGQVNSYPIPILKPILEGWAKNHGYVAAMQSRSLKLLDGFEDG